MLEKVSVNIKCMALNYICILKMNPADTCNDLGLVAKNLDIVACEQ